MYFGGSGCVDGDIVFGCVVVYIGMIVEGNCIICFGFGCVFYSYCCCVVGFSVDVGC